MDQKDVVILKKERVYNGYSKVDTYELKHRLFSGQWSSPICRETNERKDAVAVLLYDTTQDAVVLIEQFRIGALGREFTPWCIEVVAGLIEPGEKIEEVALREVREETGITINEVHYMLDYLSSPGGCTERVYLYYAHINSDDFHGCHGLPSEQEDIKIHTVPRKIAYQWIAERKIKDAVAILALQWLELKINANLSKI